MLFVFVAVCTCRYTEAIRKLRSQGVTLLRTIHMTFVPGIHTFSLQVFSSVLFIFLHNLKQ